MRLHERWTPDQIATVIEAAEAEYGKPICRFIVLRLSQLPQKTNDNAEAMAYAIAQRLGKLDAALPDVETEEANLGVCESCHHYPATAAIELPNVGVKRVCARCYGEFRNLAVQEGEDDGTRAETGSDSVQT